MVYTSIMCKHHQHLINQGIWWCELQYDKSNPNIGYYMNCDCERCPERFNEDNLISFTMESFNEQA